MREKLKDYFTFTRTERNGLAVLLSIVLLLLFLPSFFPLFVKEEKFDFTAFQKEIAQLQQIKTDTLIATTKEKPPITLHSFDPNTATIEELIQMGLSSKQAQTIAHYRKNGGKFFKKEDLKKVYGITDADYTRLEPYLIFTIVSKPVQKEFVKEKPKPLIDLNKADSLELLSLPHIGPVFASRILKFRKSLGGFTNKTQLKEIYGLKEDAFEAIEASVLVRERDVNKLNLNIITLGDLKKHAYLRAYAKQIVEYRQKTGLYKIIEEIKTVCSLTEEEWQKISPYLTVD